MAKQSITNLQTSSLEELLFIIDNYSLSYRSTLGLPKTFSFGTEVEFEKAPITKVYKQMPNFPSWNLGIDTTVRERIGVQQCGGEITSSTLIDTPKTWLELASVLEMLKQENAKVTGKAGSHIHLGAHVLEMNPNYLINFIKLWMAYEKVIYRFSYGEDLSARPRILDVAPPVTPVLYPLIRDEKSLPDEFPRLLRLIKNSTGKKSGVNFLNVFYIETIPFEEKNTVEIRTPNGTLDPHIWQTNINFFAHLLLAATNDNLDTEYLDTKLEKLKEEDFSFTDYNQLYLKEALELSNMIFTTAEDKLSFLSIYTKHFQTEEERPKILKKEPINWQNLK